MNVQIVQIVADTAVKLGTLGVIAYGLRLLFAYLTARAETVFAPIKDGAERVSAEQPIS